MKSKINKLFFITTIILSSNCFSSIENAQMINLNMQFKAHHKSVKSDLSMPFYQSAEVEKTIDKRDYLFVVNPKKGKNPDEISIEVKLYSKDKSHSIDKKEIVAKLHQESKISMKGVTFRVTPEI